MSGLPDLMTVSPDTVVRFKLGKLWVHSRALPSQPIVVDRTDLVELLNAFARPANPAAVAMQYPAGMRSAVGDMIRRLHANGLLVDATAGAGKDDAQDATAVAHRTLAELANSVYEVACDLRGMGPHAQRVVEERTGVGVLERLVGVSSAVDALSTEVRTLIDDYLNAQVAALSITPSDRHLKLHIGAGGYELPDWVNIDVSPAPLAMNIKWGLPFESGAADYVFMSHLLEHLFYPREVLDVLQDIHGVLAPDGVLRIIVPDVEKCLRAYAENDRQFFDSRRDTWSWWPKARTRLEDFLAYSGAGPDPGRLFDSHKFGYDFETLESVLKRAGFASVEHCEFMASRHAALRVDEASLVAAARFGDRHYSLFVEAVK